MKDDYRDVCEEFLFYFVNIDKSNEKKLWKEISKFIQKILTIYTVEKEEILK